MTTTMIDNLLLTAPEVAIEAGADRRKPRINVVAYTGGLMAVSGWGDVAIDLAGLDATGQIPLLADHDARVGSVVGHGQARVANGRLIVTGVMSGAGEAARQIAAMTAGGFAFQASVGVQPIEHEAIKPNQRIQLNQRTLSSPHGFTLVKRGRLREVSITTLGADGDTSVAIAAARQRKEKHMTDTASPSTATATLDEQAIRQDERDRIRRIEDICAPGIRAGWGASQARVDQLKASALAGEIDENDLNAHMLNILRESRPNVNGFASRAYRPVGHTTMLEAALLSRMGMASLGERTLGPVAMECGVQLRANHALDLCRAALEFEGIDAPRGREEMVKAALSTYSLPTALGNLANKLLLDAYEETPATWQSFCSVRSVADFKPNTAIRPSYTGSLSQVAHGGELKHGSVDEWFTTFHADTYGKILSIDRRDIINDDLGVFDQAARAMGSAAMRKVSDLVYETLLGNAGGFFSAGHRNLLTGADSNLTFDALAAAIKAMMVQRDDEGNDLDLRPATLLVPPALQTTAKALLESEFIQQLTEHSPTGNSLRKAVGLEVEPRLSNTDKFGNKASDRHWYLLARPAATPMVVAFLNGRQQPTVEFFGLDQDVKRLAVSWRVYHDFGAALVDPRAAVRSKGQA